MSVDIANDFFPVEFQQAQISVNGITDFGVSLKSFTNGFLLFWAPISYTDGTYNLSIQESTDGGATGSTIDDERIIVPQIAKDNGLNNDNLLEIASPGNVFLGTIFNVPRQVGVIDFATDAARIVINSSGVTVGADILVQIWAKSVRLAIRDNNLL